MARPLATAKKSVDLPSSGEARVSRIRRDPPPPKLKELSIDERNERDQRMAVIGIAAFALAIFFILLAVAAWSGWTPRAYTVHI